MRATTQSLMTNTTPSAGSGFAAGTGPGHARTFGGGTRPIVDVQARVRFREDHERGGTVVSGVPRPRALQILDAVLRLPAMERVEQRHLRVDLHRDDGGRWSHHYGLAVAAALVSSLARRPVPADHLLVGDLDLRGGVRDVPPAVVDAFNAAVEAFAVETPLTVLLAPDSAAWVRSSSTVRVVPCRTLADVAAAVWPNVSLVPQ